jgi:hypothetical protein
MVAHWRASGQTMQASTMGHSMSVLHSSVAHSGLLYTHSRFSLQYDAAMMGAAPAAQLVPTHGVQMSPQDLPSHGETSPQLSMPLVQTPSTQSDQGQTVEPSAHMVQGAALTGHSASVMHI